ncbi:translocation protein [Tilletiopsis washingtonensis]|uniref:Translocation protein SEC62 n=1 Tax=Tilletiopsis washingtonensis TaxID=58919 RepID=A0A316Z276_9BASI|nr:translocation protein [Tilletiopsis washingtonensis]PWN95659.1 translocation protein [Tilletiopsis washingtonensis]
MEQQSAAPPAARALVEFLRASSTGPKTRVGLLGGQRRDHFKGSGAVKALLAPAYKKAQAKKKSTLPPIADEEQAEQALHAVIPYAFFLRVDRAESGGKERHIQVNQMQLFRQDLYYAWFYDGSQLLLQLSGFGMILLMLAGVMFPLWPASLRVGVWYLSIGVLGLIGAFFGLAILRLIFYCISLVVLRPGVWIFPNLFEDVGFVDSFIPLWAWDIPAPKKSKKPRAVDGSEAQSTGQAAIANLPGQAGPAEANVSSAPEAAPSAPAATPKNRGNGGGGGGGAGGAAATASQQQQTPARRIERPSENLSALD